MGSKVRKRTIGIPRGGMDIPFPVPISICRHGEGRRGEGVGPSVSPSALENRIRVRYSGKSWQNGLPTERRRRRPRNFYTRTRARSIDLLAGFSSLRRRFETPRNRRIRNWNADVLETRILLGNYRERYRVNRSRVGEDVALELAVALLPRSRGGSFDTTPPQFFFPPPFSN